MVRVGYISKIIIKYSLEAATKRDLPLFSFDCIVEAYNKPLKKIVGFSYGTMAALGGRNKFQAMLNESYVAAEMGKFIEKNFRHLNKKIFFPITQIFNDTQRKIKEIDRIIYLRPEYGLKIITEIYPQYFLGVGLYNCFWRYLGEEKSKGKLSFSFVKYLGIRRDKYTRLYPQIEKRIQLCTSLIGRDKGFDGDLLRYFTLDEMKSYLKKHRITKSTLSRLAQRRREYFYLFVPRTNKKYVLTDKKIISEIKNKFFKVSRKVSVLTGHSAYHGMVKGFVYNLTNKRKAEHPQKNFILVASMTHPKDVALIAKSAAIVTDEGGILCHAAIIAREMNKPCIIGTKIATKVLKDGQLVEVDANKGLVKIIKE